MQRTGRRRCALGEDADHGDAHELGDLPEIALVIITVVIEGLGIEAARDGTEITEDFLGFGREFAVRAFGHAGSETLDEGIAPLGERGGTLRQGLAVIGQQEAEAELRVAQRKRDQIRSDLQFPAILGTQGAAQGKQGSHARRRRENARAEAAGQHALEPRNRCAAAQTVGDEFEIFVSAVHGCLVAARKKRPRAAREMRGFRLTQKIAAPIVPPPRDAMKASMDAQQLKILEHRADELIRLCARMDQEIRSLKATERMLREERSQLVRKNEDARSKVEAMIMRLRSLEQDS